MARPASKSREALRRNLKDVERLLTFSANVRMVSQRAETLGVLNKSGIVLLNAAWESYCEDVAAEVIYHLAQHGRSWQDIPQALQKRIARELEQDRHELAVWRLAGEGWRDVLTNRVAERRSTGRWGVQSPVARRVAQFFADDVGIDHIDKEWRWTGVDPSSTAAALDAFVNLRHAVAHGPANATRSISKTQVKEFRRLIIRLADLTDAHLESVVTNLTDSSMWAYGAA